MPYVDRQSDMETPKKFQIKRTDAQMKKLQEAKPPVDPVSITRGDTEGGDEKEVR